MNNYSNFSLSNNPNSHSTLESPNGTPEAITSVKKLNFIDNEIEQMLPTPATPNTLVEHQKSEGPKNPVASIVTLVAIALMILGLAIDNVLLGYTSAIIVILSSVKMIWPSWGKVWKTLIPSVWRNLIIACFGLLAAIVGLLMLSGANQQPGSRNIHINWDAIGAVGELIGALGQILIAIIAVYVAWRQYVISKDLTIQQNRITQQQTIDAYFQGVSDLAMDEKGFLEDWPQERAIAEGRTAAIIKSVDEEGKAKILRFLSQSRLVTPIKRDRLLGRPIFDGQGGYAEDREHGTRVIDLGVMLAGADLKNTDLRWTELSDANLVRANLSGCDLVKANFSRTILYEASLVGADLRGVRFFYGTAEYATPRSRTHIPNYQTGAYTGAVIENVDFTEVKRLSDEQHYYCCAWSGEKSRKTIPNGCEGIPNKLGC
ncbi:MAG: pentapeptide repeat-containing protein [Trichodesmium sp. St16_bin4-tuft]|nr:pentapeptide repeat-containing protein [Trichodesmium sp. St16_bin4-tuft]